MGKLPEGKTAIIVGSRIGTGKAIALTVGEEEAKVELAARSPKELQGVCV